MTKTSTAIASALTLVALIIAMGISPAAAVSPSSYENQVLKATNKYRSSHGKAAVKHQSCVDKWAEGQAQWMADNHVMAHRSGRLLKVMKDCKLTGASENIAWNFSSGTKTVAAWAKSSGHAKNMRTGKMRYMGVGAVKDSNGEWWVAQVFGTKK